jgi:hypothetical protein
MLWEFLHGAASLCTPADASRFSDLLASLSVLLPCDLCLKDYPQALDLLATTRGQNAAQACAKGDAVAFVHDLHAAVNAKLARQRYADLRTEFSDLPEDPSVASLRTLFPGLPLAVLRRKSALLSPCPFHIESLCVLLLVLCSRLSSRAELEQYLHFLDSAAVMLARVAAHSVDAQRVADRLTVAWRVLSAKLEACQAGDSEQHSKLVRGFYRVMRCAYVGRALDNKEDEALVARIAMAQSGWQERIARAQSQSQSQSQECQLGDDGCA